MENPALVVTSVEDVTADLVIEALNNRRVPVVRVDPADLGDGMRFSARIEAAERQWTGNVSTPSRRLDLARVRSVYWRRPGPWRYTALPQQAGDFATAEARHGLIGLLSSLPALHVSHPIATARAEYKPAQLAAAADLGFAVPPTLITNDLGQARQFIKECAPVVYKTFRGVLASEDGHRGVIWTQRVDAADLDESMSVCPHMFQAEVTKAADVRVTVVGDRVFSSVVRTRDGLLDLRACDWDTLTYEPCEVPDTVSKKITDFLQAFGLAFGCFDFIIDPDGAWWWIECNPNGQWGFLPDSEAIADAFAAVLQAG